MLARSAFRGVSPSVRAFSTTRQSQLAKMTLIGRLGAQPQTAQDKQGRDIMIYSVATNDRAAPNADGTRGEPSTTWHRVLSYNTAGKDYLSSLPSGTLVHIEADFKKRTNRDDAGNYNEQTLLLMKTIDVLARPAKAAESTEASESS